MTADQTSRLAAAVRSDAGRVRGNNEDLFVCDAAHGIFAVIDGVGGQSAGEVAAEIARRTILERLARPLGTAAERAREAIALANNEIFKAAEERPEYAGMTCVLTLALVAGRRVTIGHVGDSRLYKIGPGGMRKLTHDHSPVGEREDRNEIGELDAMRHPRRNEVFRDVGSTCRDKDADGFVEIVEDTIEDDEAILLCTDGLTDMVTSARVEGIVDELAGDPQAVVDALVAAANDEGGKDNVTVVYAEAPEFARAARGARADAESAPPSDRSDAWHWALARRTTWFACGTMLGVIAALVLAWGIGGITAAARRTFSVGEAGSPYKKIADALKVARAGDTVQLEPGTYAERIVVPDGVDLVARVPGTSTLTSDKTPPNGRPAITVAGSGRIYGIRIESTPDAPIGIGIRASGADRRIESVDFDGPMRAAIELTEATAASIYGCRIRTSQGPAITMTLASDVIIAANTFIRAGAAGEPALLLKDELRPLLSRNLFAGYGAEVVRGISPDQRAQLLSGNFIVGAEPVTAR